MKANSIKKLCGIVLSAATIMSMATVGFADMDAQGNNTTAGTGSTVPVVVTAAAPTFKAILPLSLPVSVDATGKVTPATNAKIENESSYGKIRVKGVVVTAATKDKDGNALAKPWNLNEFDAAYATMPVNARNFGFKINTIAIPKADGTIADSNFGSTSANLPAIEKGASLAIKYDALIAPQSDGLDGETVGSTVFTIGWDD